MTMDYLVQQPIWTGAYHHGGLAFHHLHHFTPYYFPRKRNLPCSFYSGSCGLSSSLDDEVGFSTDIKLESTNDCIPEDDKDFKICVVCGEKASGFYFGALVCLPCKSFYIRCTKDGEPTFTCQCNGNCDIAKQGRIRCQYCRYQRCIMAGMCRKEKPETVQPAEGQVLCKVCGDIANGIHFGVNTCEGCKKFFRRGLVENQGYNCKGEKSCQINPRNRNNCRYCRYQKCISAGMSREAIKMGRPKKSDGDSPQHSPAHSPSFNNSPEMSPQGSPHSVSPQLSPVNESLFHKYMIPTNQPVKTETTCPPPSCQIQSEMTNSRPVLSSTPFMGLKSEEQFGFNWSTSSSGNSNWCPVTENGIMSSQCPPVTTSVEPTSNSTNTMLVEDDMDDILNFIQMDQATRTADSRFSNNRDTSSCLFESQTPNSRLLSNQLTIDTCNSYLHTSSQSPPYEQYPQQNHASYYPVSQSPQFFQQSHSPVSNSPQSFHGAPPSPEQNYHQSVSPNTFSGSASPHFQGYQDSSLQSGIAGPPSYFSSSQNCYQAHSPLSGCNSPPASVPSTDYHQNNTTRFPMSDVMGHMPNFNSVPAKEIYIDKNNLNSINEMFIKCMGHVKETPNRTPGTLTRDQLSREVISYSLKSSPYKNDCLYSSDDNSSHDSSDYITNSSQKRKQHIMQPEEVNTSYVSNPYMLPQNTQSDFVCEKYSLQKTQHYWKQHYPFNPMYRMSDNERMTIEHIINSFLAMRTHYDESKMSRNRNMNMTSHWPKMGQQESGCWSHVQERIVRNTRAYTEFCMKLPGFDMLDHADQHDLLQSSCFMAALIICASQWYDRDLKKFHFFWNWTISPENPMYLFKLHLVQAGDAISKLDLTDAETAFVMALCCFGADLMNLNDPDSVERARRNILFLFQQHLAEHGVDPDERLRQIFSVLPICRHISFWHKELMKNMRVDMELGAVSKLVEGISL